LATAAPPDPLVTALMVVLLKEKNKPPVIPVKPE
jgi:hypothetical protein